MKIVTLVISLMLTPANCQTKGEGIILGQVMVTGKTTAPSGVAVIATRIREISRDGWGKLVASGTLYSGATSTNVKGEFAIENLPVGRYYVCALGKPPNWIGTCEWNRPPSVVDVVAGARASVELGLNEGEALRVTVMDPRGRIAESTRFGLGIITDDGYYKHAGVPTISGGVREYLIPVPKNISVRLFLDSAFEVFGGGNTLVRSGEPSLRPTRNPEGNLSVVLSVP